MAIFASGVGGNLRVLRPFMALAFTDRMADTRTIIALFCGIAIKLDRHHAGFAAGADHDHDHLRHLGDGWRNRRDRQT